MTSETPLALIQDFKRRHRFILYALPVLFMIVACIVLMAMPSRYTATGLIEIMPRGSDLSPLSTVQAQLPTDSMVLTQVEIIRSSAVLKRAADVLQQSLPAVEQAVTAAPIGRSYIMRVKAQAADPDMAQKLANTVMQEYLLYKMKLRSKRLQATSGWLRQQLAGLSQGMHQSASAASQYQHKAQLLDTRNIPVTDQQLSDLSTLIIDAKTEQAAIHATDHVSSHSKKNKAVSEQVKSPVLSSLAEDEAALSMKLAELKQKYGPKHPTLQAAQAEMAGLQSRKQQEIARLNAAIHEERTIIDQKIANLAKQFETLKDQRQSESQATIQLQTLKDEAEADRALYDSLLKQSKELGLYANLEPADSQVIAWAEKPLRTSNPNILLVLILSAMAGLMLAVVAALLTDQMTSPLTGDHHAYRV